MKVSVYYNEFDKKKCAALKSLMEDGHISEGDIDDRPIQEVMPDDLQGYRRCHFFAGIGLWDYALDLARWEEGRRVWTGSCPCQPFSAAGGQKGKADDRHLWPQWLRLIKKCQPPVIFGEQVASAITHGWLDDVYQGLEAENYAVGAAVLPACSVGAPHRRERLWFVGYNNQARQLQPQRGIKEQRKRFSNTSSTMGNSEHHGQSADTVRRSSTETIQHHQERPDSSSKFKGAGASGQLPISSWSSGVWINCPDGKQRLIERQLFSLAHGDTSDMVTFDEKSMEKINVATNNTRDTQALRFLQGGNEEEAIQRSIGESSHIQQEKILQHSLWEQQTDRARSDLRTTSKKIPQRMLRELSDYGKITRSPYRSQHKEQRSVELADIMCHLSFEISLGEWSQEAEAATPLQCLRDAFSKEGYVSETLPKIQKVWGSIVNEKREQIVRNLLCKRNYYWGGISLLKNKQPNRKELIHCEGDAIVPQLAAKFIESFTAITGN